MTDRILSAVTLVVPDYDQAIEFYVQRLGFDLIEDTRIGATKRWVRVQPSGGGCCLLLAKAADANQQAAIGNQTGGRVGFFLQTDDFFRDYEAFNTSGVTFLEAPRQEDYGIVAVFADPFGNTWDLIEHKR